MEIHFEHLNQELDNIKNNKKKLGFNIHDKIQHLVTWLEKNELFVSLMHDNLVEIRLEQLKASLDNPNWWKSQVEEEKKGVQLQSNANVSQI